MKKQLIALSLLTCADAALGDNPLVTHIYTADPSAHVFDGVLYVYPSHDIPEYGGLTGHGNFMMGDYHVFSTTDLMNFEDHGVALDQHDVPWAEPNFTMWAPDCNVKDGTYYFYFPMNFKVGVATSKSPTGPFIPEPAPIPHADEIDPCIFIDDDGTPYLYIGGGKQDSLSVTRMKPDMKTPDMEPQILIGLGTGYKEGPFMFKRNGIYYLTYPYTDKGPEEIHYAISRRPLGPFKPQGKIMDRWKRCWTNHHSIVQYKGKWYIFYHHMDISGDKSLRSMCAEELFFNDDGSIQKVIPTRRGIGIRNAGELIQIDRYLAGSEELTTPRFTKGETRGLYLSGISDGSWINYPDVDFSKNGFSGITVRISASQTGTIEVRTESKSGPLLGTITVNKTTGWEHASAALTSAGRSVKGFNDLYLIFKGSGADLFEVDWIQFTRSDEARLYFAGEGIGEVLINGNRTVKSFHNTAGIKAPAKTSVTAKAHDGSTFSGWLLNGVPTDQIGSVQAGDELTAVFTQDYPELDGLTRLEAEAYTEQSGIKTVKGEGKSKKGAVGYIENGDSLIFRNVSFSRATTSLTARAASESNGGTISVHLNDPDSTAVATLNIPGTGNWKNWKDIQSEPCSIPAGTYDLYLKFSGNSEFLFNLNWIQFTGE